MVQGYHLIITAYGFWLPNDPRGSWSDFVGAWELRRFGPATKVNTRRSRASTEHDRQLRLDAKSALKYPPVSFTGEQALSVSRGFAKTAEQDQLRVWACAILPEHAHLVIGRHPLTIERIAQRLKRGATRQLVQDCRHPFQHLMDDEGRVPKVWARGQWKSILNNESDIRRAIGYVELNPIKERKRRQYWAFVTPFVAPFGRG
ncbi:MAG: hypothetical protein AB7I48_06655 [Planctomycetaceae bacterium]